MREEQKLETLRRIKAAGAALEEKRSIDVGQVQPEPPAARSMPRKQHRSPRKVSHAAVATSAEKQGDSALSGPAAPAKIASSPRKKKNGSQNGLKPWTTGSSPGGGKRRQAAEAEAAAAAATSRAAATTTTTTTLAAKSPSTPRTPPRLRKSPHKGSPRKDHSKYFLDLQPQNGDVRAIVDSIETAWHGQVEHLGPPQSSRPHLRQHDHPGQRLQSTPHSSLEAGMSPRTGSPRSGRDSPRRSSGGSRMTAGAEGIREALSIHIEMAEQGAKERRAEQSQRECGSSFLPELHPLHPCTPPSPRSFIHSAGGGKDFLRVATSSSHHPQSLQTPIVAYRRRGSSPPPEDSEFLDSPTSIAKASLETISHEIPPTRHALVPVHIPTVRTQSVTSASSSQQIMKMLPWEDPLIPNRRRALESSRIIRKAPTGQMSRMLNQGKPHVEELDTGDIEADIARAETLLDENAILEAHNLKSVKTFLDSRNDGKTWRIPRLPRTVKKMPPYQLKSGGIVWDKLTGMERSALPVGHEQEKKSGFGVAELIENQGKLLERHCKVGILQETMGAVRWGAKDESTDKGGLLQLHESMRESAERVPQLMKMIDKGKELIEMMSSEQTQEKVLEAAATVSATGVEARQCASYFVETMTREEEDAPRVHEAAVVRVEDAGIEELDEGLQQIWRERQEQDILRQNIKWGEEDQVVKKTGINPALLRPEMTILDRTTIDKVHEMRAANRKHLERSMKPEEIHKHIKFHRDIRYMQYKTGVFKAVVLQNDYANHAQQELRWRENQETEEGSSFTRSTQQKTETAYFLRITVLQARDLPKMDDSKLDTCYNDTYVRLTLRGNGKIIETADGHSAMFNTPVVWEQENPNFNAHFDFDVPPPHKIQSVTLTVEVFDVDTTLGEGHHEDHLIGLVEFNIIKDSARAMPMEKEFHEWNSLNDRQGKRVRNNFGKVGSYKLGEDAQLKLNMIYTKKLPKGLREYAMTIQQSLRCMAARKQMRAERVKRATIDQRPGQMNEMLGDLDTRHIWESYLACCIQQRTHAVGLFKVQISKQTISLRNYSLFHPGVVSLCGLLAPMGQVNRLRSLELVNNNLSGSGMAAIADALEGSGNRFEVLHIEQNPILKESNDSKSLNTRENKLGSGMTGMQAICRVLNNCQHLLTLSIASCSIGDKGLSAIAPDIASHPSLTSLKLDNNDIELPLDVSKSAGLLGESIAQGQILEFSYSRNRLQGKDALVLLGDVKLNRVGVLHSGSLRRLVLVGNGLFKHDGPATIISNFLTSDKCLLDFLDLSDNMLGVEGAQEIGDALVDNTSLHDLILDDNHFGRQGYAPIMQHRGRRKVLSQGKEVAAADGAGGLPVAKSLDEINAIFKQFDTNQDGNMDFDELVEFMKLLGNDWDKTRLREHFLQMLDTSSRETIDFSSFYSWYSTQIASGPDGGDAIKVRMENCGVVIKSAQFDIQDPDGEYDLDMTVVRNRGILIALMKLVYGGEGEFVEGSCYKEEVTDGRDKVDRQPFEIIVHPDISSWEIPTDCYLTFEFKRTKEHEFLGYDMEAVHHVRQAFRLEPPKGSREHRDSTVDRYFHHGTARMSSLQVIELLHMLDELSSNSDARLESLQDERVHLVVRTYRTIRDTENSPLVLEELAPRERRVAEKRLGFAPFHFGPQNPTGRHRLRLGKVSERQIAIKLIELRESQMPLLKMAKIEYNAHSGGPRPEIERVMRNTRLGGKRFHYTDTWKVPLQGVLEVDYVETTKPGQECVPMEPGAFVKFRDQLKAESIDDSDMVLAIRKQSLVSYFTCLQVLALIELFDISQEHSKYLRGEVFVCMFARVIDWRGYSVLLKHVGVDGQEDVIRRIGYVNLFHDSVVSPVGYWSLHLQNPEERWVMQELVHLASTEPGDNMLHTKLDRCDFEVPSDWLSNVPKKTANITLFYGRSKSVSDEILAQAGFQTVKRSPVLPDAGAPKPPPAMKLPCFPPKFMMPTLPGGDEWSFARDGSTETWINLEKVRNIADSMRRTSASAKEMFELMDDDSGGSLSRDELSHALFTIGVWLPPDDMKTLLNVLDVDGSGEIDQGELEIFWNNAPPLRYLDESQKQYWLKRNVKLDVYSKSMPFHDIRVLYERAVIDLYGMKNPLYTHTFERIGKNVKMDKSFNERRRSSRMRLDALTSVQMRRNSARFMLEDDIADALMDDYIQESVRGGGADEDEALDRGSLFRSLGVRSDLMDD